jgi:hypothetical protein
VSPDASRRTGSRIFALIGSILRRLLYRRVRSTGRPRSGIDDPPLAWPLASPPRVSRGPANWRARERTRWSSPLGSPPVARPAAPTLPLHCTPLAHEGLHVLTPMAIFQRSRRIHANVYEVAGLATALALRITCALRDRSDINAVK